MKNRLRKICLKILNMVLFQREYTSVLPFGFHTHIQNIECRLNNSSLRIFRIIGTYSSFGFTPLNMKNKTKYEEQAPENMPKDLEYGSVSTTYSEY